MASSGGGEEERASDNRLVGIYGNLDLLCCVAMLRQSRRRREARARVVGERRLTEEDTPKTRALRFEGTYRRAEKA